MNIEQIARECGFDYDTKDVFITCPSCYTDIAILPALRKFASRIRQEAMEEAARICEGEAAKWDDGASIVSWGAKVRCAKAIRAAGKEA